MSISFFDLLWLLVPFLIAAFLYVHYTKDFKSISHAFFRMVFQLIFVGYLLVFIFGSDSFFIICLVLFVMLFFASMISMRVFSKKVKRIYFYAFFSIFAGGVGVLFWSIFFVIKPKIWYEPRFLIPLAGMLFSNAMNTLSLFIKNFEQNRNFVESLKIALLPIINSFFAVGVVSLPGMMSGQILSGVDPLVAVRYQIMIMVMIFSSSTISVTIFLNLLKNDTTLDKDQEK